MAGAFFSQDDLIELLRRNTDRDGWLDPLLADPASRTAIDAMTAIMSRTSLAADRDCGIGSISDSPGGSPGTSVLTLARTASGTSGTIPRGYLFRDSRGVRALAQTPIPVASGALSVIVPVITLRQSEVINSEDDAVFAVDPESPIVLDGADTTVLIAPPGSAGLVSTSFSAVASATPIQGGTSDWLSEHGRERGVKRQSGEATGDYRLRVRNIPAAVSPIAVADGVEAAASRVALAPVVVEEPFEDQASAQAKADHGLGSFQPLYASGAYPNITDSPQVDFFDDMAHEAVSNREARAYFRVETPGRLSNPDDQVLFFDFGFLNDYSFGFPDIGTHPQVRAALLAIFEEADRKRAGGVKFDVVLPLEKKLVASGQDDSASETVVATLTPPVGKCWLLVDVHLGHVLVTGAGPDLNTYHKLRLTFEDASVFETPEDHQLWEEDWSPRKLAAAGADLTKRVTLIEGVVKSNASQQNNLAVFARVLEAAL